jgi:putative tricarboxylic transport membrane protein
MAVVESLFDALLTVLSWPTIGWLFVGLIIGIVVGALPGLAPATGMAILLTLTLPLEQKMALILLVSIYAGSMYGGSISAILMNAPGTPGAAASPSTDTRSRDRGWRATHSLPLRRRRTSAASSRRSC